MNNIGKIIEDITNRDVYIAMILVETKEGKLQFMQYDDKGNVIFLSDTAENIQVNEVLQGNMRKPLFRFGNK